MCQSVFPKKSLISLLWHGMSSRPSSPGAQRCMEMPASVGEILHGCPAIGMRADPSTPHEALSGCQLSRDPPSGLNISPGGPFIASEAPKPSRPHCGSVVACNSQFVSQEICNSQIVSLNSHFVSCRSLNSHFVRRKLRNPQIVSCNFSNSHFCESQFWQLTNCELRPFS